MLGDRRYCYPLAITDFASRYLLTCEALSTTQEKVAFTVFRAHLQGIRGTSECDVVPRPYHHLATLVETAQ